ncbi:MAG: glycine cleavage system protein GcvH [Peptococcaceae bacterium]
MAEVNKKPVEELIFNHNLYYYHEHTWARIEDNKVTVGITDYAQDQLGEIIFIELPAAGEEFGQGDVFGQAESAKTVSALYMPVSGKILAVNEELEDDPEIVNTDPYGAGWMIAVEIKDAAELEKLLTKDAYLNLLVENQ